ncbi:MAG TPA: M23 family metallopeptidase [Xanthomonadales bacterium]|nr:M23 family metallopeptidase [Xanthomonadales bacterium]
MIRLVHKWAAFGLLAVSNLCFALPVLDYPLQDPLHRGIYIMNYFDQTPGAGESDYACGASHTYDGHQGTDFSVYSFRAMDKGTWVLAAAPGNVTATRFDQFDRNYETPYVGSGNFVQITHEDGSVAYYWHLLENSTAVVQGERVERGQRLGLVGSSGASPIPHLHFEVWENGSPVDPFGGPCNNAPGAWREQPEHVGDAEFRFFDAGITDQAVALGTGTYQLNFGMRPLKDTPLPALQISQESQVISLWVHFQGRGSASFQFQLINPSGTVVYDRAFPLFKKWEFAWRLQKVTSSQIEGGLISGDWTYQLVHAGEIVYQQGFTVGSESLYPPRFYPLAGRAVRLGSGALVLPMELIGATGADVRFMAVGVPQGVQVVNDEIRIASDTELDHRIGQGMVVAADSSGNTDTYILNFIDTRAPVDDQWRELRTDRLNHSMTGAWYNPLTAGQGMFMEHFEAQDLLFAGWFAFGLAEGNPPDRPDWLVASGTPERNRIVLDLVRADGGRLLDPESPVSFSEFGTVGTMAIVTNGCKADVAIDFRDRDLDFSEPDLARIVTSEACQLNDPVQLSDHARRITGNWYDPGMDGQGLMLEFIESQQRIFGNWFTFTPDGERKWFVVIGDYNEVVTSLDVLEIISGELNAPGASDPVSAGNAEIVWGDECGTATLTFSQTGSVSLVSELIKIGPAGCDQ